jgi:hypothetical protein
MGKTYPLHEFYEDAKSRAESTDERFGQALFNLLHTVRPDLSEQIRGTDKDPFYVDRSHLAYSLLSIGIKRTKDLGRV